MGIPRKSLRVFAILLAGVLWSASSLAFWPGNIGRFVLRPASTSHQGQWAEINIRLHKEVYGASWNHNLFPQEVSIIEMGRNTHLFLLASERFHGGTDIGRGFPRLVFVAAPYQDQLKLPILEANGMHRPYDQGILQQYSSTAFDLDRHDPLPNHEKFRGSTYQFQKRENRRIGDDIEDEIREFLKEEAIDIARETMEELIECLAKHWHNGHSLDSDFFFDAIQECDDEEELSKLELGREKLFDKLVSFCRLDRDDFPCSTNGKDPVILNVPIWERDFYNSPNKWKEIQSKFAPISISRNSLAPYLPLPSWRGDFSSQGLTPGLTSFRTTANAYRELGMRRYLDIEQSRALDLKFGNEAID